MVVTRLDRLARSTRDLLNILDDISKRGASFRSLADTWADTTTAQGRLMLTILGGLAEFERTLIQSRTEAGIQKGPRARQEVRPAKRSLCRSEAQDRRSLRRRRDHGGAGAGIRSRRGHDLPGAEGGLMPASKTNEPRAIRHPLHHGRVSRSGICGRGKWWEKVAPIEH